MNNFSISGSSVGSQRKFPMLIGNLKWKNNTNPNTRSPGFRRCPK
jgi:hypothetical protein